jgi:hypothetical protein
MDAKVALVIRPNGDIPFDDGHPHKAVILGELVANGHTLNINPETGNHRIVSGPLLEHA